MALSPEAIIAMIALFIACVPAIQFIISYYQTNIRQESGIQNTSLSQPTTSHLIIQPPGLLQASSSVSDISRCTYFIHADATPFRELDLLLSAEASGQRGNEMPWMSRKDTVGLWTLTEILLC
jgi:hypothetical protein